MNRSLFLILIAALLYPRDGSACAHAVLKKVFLAMDLSAGYEKNYRWDKDGVLSGQTVSSSFWHFLGREGIPRFLRERKALGKSTHVVEFFGSAVFIKKDDLADSVTGVRLERHYYDDGTPVAYDDDIYAPLSSPRWQEIEGNIYRRDTWSRVDANRRERNIPAFDLIVVRPFGGVNPQESVLEKSQDLSTIVVNRMYERLSADDGVLLVNLMVEIPGKEVWTKRLLESGVQIDWDPNATFGFRIIKDKNSPARLPKMN